jgi:hypothetical protein
MYVTKRQKILCSMKLSMCARGYALGAITCDVTQSLASAPLPLRGGSQVRVCVHMEFDEQG